MLYTDSDPLESLPVDAQGVEWRPAAIEEAIQRAALRVCGEVGYAQLNVQAILARSGVSRSSFFRHYHGKGDCFSAAYTSAAERLADRLLARARRWPEWPNGLRAGLIELLLFCEAEPGAAYSLLSEFQAAGAGAVAAHERLKQRLADALDSGRALTSPHQSAPPPGTANLIVGGVAETLQQALRREESGELWGLLPGLMHLAAVHYLGPEAAEAEWRLDSAAGAGGDAQARPPRAG